MTRPRNAHKPARRDGKVAAGETATGTAEARQGASGAVYRVEIPGYWPALLNQYLYGHWTVRCRMKAADRWTIGVACVAAGVPLARTKRRVTLTLVLGPRQRKCDGDAPWKGLLDGLKACGALVDDNTDWAEMAPLRFERGAEKAAIIELEDLGS